MLPWDYNAFIFNYNASARSHNHRINGGIHKTVSPPTAQQKLSKNLGFKYFKKADDDDRAGMASMGTAGMFRKASQLFTVALGLQQDAQVDEWTKYSKFKAVYISKEIKAGRVPEAPDGGGAAAPFDMPGPSAVDPYGGVPSMAPIGGGFDSGGYGAPPAMAPVGGVPSMAPIGGGDGYNPYGAPMQPVQPVQPVPPVQPVQPVQPISMPTLPPGDSAYPSTATTGDFTAPGTINSLPPVAAPVYVPPTPTTPHTRTSAPARASTTNSGLYNPKQTLTASEMGLAKKHCNFALSALQYNDPQTVVDNLLQALGHLSH